MPTTAIEQADALHSLAALFDAVEEGTPCWVQTMSNQQATIHLDAWSLPPAAAQELFDATAESLTAVVGAMQPTPRGQYLVHESEERWRGWRIGLMMLDPAQRGASS